MKNVIFIAPPASGKGTQSKNLVKLGYIHISSGDLLREEIAKGSSLGTKINDIIAKGNLVDDNIVFELIENKISNLDRPFILDGFPRTINQTIKLDSLLKNLNIDNYEVIYLDVSIEEALKRALGRLTCKCGLSYNIYYKELSPKENNICDVCKSTLTKRSDDNEESFKIRYETFIRNIEPIKEFYKSKNKLHSIDTSIDTLMITERIKDILK